jgi:hypothetical protein
MPVWLLSIIINFALKFGIPALIAWLKRRWGISVTSQEVEDLLITHHDLTQATKAGLKQCAGIACPSDLKE